MCGLAGYLTRAPVTPDASLLRALFASIRARGPDDEGLCLMDRTAGVMRAFHTERSVPRHRALLPSYADTAAWIRHDVALLHTRYAVMDLSDDAHQPFWTPNGEVVVAFQGEIFNYVELRAQLEGEGLSFRTASDTEVLAQAYLAWGDDTWPRLNGFWSAIVLDGRTRRVVLCRDRLGVAPLHVAQTTDALFFGTSALGLATASGAGYSRARVRDFVETGLKDFDAHSCFEGVRAVRPGTFLSFERDQTSLSTAREQRYWNPPARLSRADLSLDQAAGLLRETLTSAVEYRLRGGRSIAFQLSGGLDSTTITALASSIRSDPLPTYTVSIPEQDEEPLARSMTKRFALRRTVLRDLGAGLVGEAVGFARLMEEPVQAPSAFAHHEMCRRMKADGFGVTLSGSGGDEVLAGYEWDFWPAARWLVIAERGRLNALVQEAFFRYGSWRRVADRLKQWAGRARDWRRGSREHADAGPGAPGRAIDASALAGGSVLADRASAVALLGSYDALDYDGRRRFHLCVAHLPYYLASNDRATLGIPLEHRQPFLDHRVVELGLRMPPSYLFQKGWTKYVLRKAMERMLPPEIVWRREKLGFPFPPARVLRADPAFWAAAADRARQEGVADVSNASFDEMAAEDPLRLWRVCSVGLWLDAVA